MTPAGNASRIDRAKSAAFTPRDWARAVTASRKAAPQGTV
jgi:hypothetical protein